MKYKIDKRIAFVPVTEVVKVAAEFPFVGKLSEVPDLAANVSISQMTRVYSMPHAATEFFIDRTGNIYFSSQKANQLITVSYMGGGSRLSALDWNEMVDTVTRTNALITDLSNLIFGNIKLRVTPTVITTPAATLNTKLSGQHTVSFSASLANNSNQVYTWLKDIPLYLTVRKSTVDSDILAPAISPAINSLKFVDGVCNFTATYNTDYGTYKKYTPGDYVSYSITTVDPTTSLGINLTANVVDTIT